MYSSLVFQGALIVNKKGPHLQQSLSPQSFFHIDVNMYM